jgi:hypothetical protein
MAPANAPGVVNVGAPLFLPVNALVFPPLPPLPPPDPNITQLGSAARLVAEVAKIYTEEQKYDSSNGSFDHKLVIFHDIC